MRNIRRISTFLFIALSLGYSSALSQTQLVKFAREQSARWQTARAAAESLARAANMPIRSEYRDGSVIELQRFSRGRPMYYKTNDLTGAGTISTKFVWPAGGGGFSLTGYGDTLGEWDAGAARMTHQEFGGRVLSTQGSLVDHSTHVAGILIAAGVVPTAKGMAYQADLQEFDWNNDLSEMATAAAAGLRVSNHSYGLITGWDYNYFNDGLWAWFGDPTISPTQDYRFGFYDDEARTWDSVAYDAPYYLIAKAAGNDRGEGPMGSVTHWVYVNGGWVQQTTVRQIDGGPTGYNCLNGGSCGKNILAVGAVIGSANGYTYPGGVLMSYFSSWGPTDDGRIKPDIVTDGVNVYSAVASTDNAYATMSGTSMATPGAVGSIGLLLQYQRILHGSTPLLASTLKALIIHTADEAGPKPGTRLSVRMGFDEYAKGSTTHAARQRPGLHFAYPGTVAAAGGYNIMEFLFERHRTAAGNDKLDRSARGIPATFSQSSQYHVGKRP